MPVSLRVEKRDSSVEGIRVCNLSMAGSIRHVADWADKSQGNRQELWDAIAMEADEGLIRLGVEIARWNVDEVRAIHDFVGVFSNNQISSLLWSFLIWN